MIRCLQAESRQRGVVSLEAVALPVEELVLPAGSVDLVVSSYALHHLRDADKARLISAASGWLRPGGRLIIADMMLGRGGSAETARSSGPRSRRWPARAPAAGGE